MTKTLVPIICISVLLLFCGGVIFYMHASPRFEIVNLGVRGHSRLTPEIIAERLDIQPHTNIFQIRLDDIQRKLEEMTWVKEARVFRNFPQKLSIQLTERVPFALVKLGELYLVDRDAVVLGALASGSEIRLPIITGSFVQDVTQDGENLRLQYALHALEALMGSSYPFSRPVRKIQIESLENVTLVHDGDFPEIRLSLQDYTYSFKRLEKIYPDLEPEKLAVIDLRFDKRVILRPKNI